MDRSQLTVRKRDNGIFYWRTLPKGQWKSTGARTEADAWRAVLEKAGSPGNVLSVFPGITFGEYAKDFFIWDKCRRVAHRRLHRKRISPEHAAAQRSILVRYILGDPEHKDNKGDPAPIDADPLAALRMTAIDRAALDAFEMRLKNKLGIVDESSKSCRVFNSVLIVLSTVFAWAIREKVCTDNPVGGELLSYEKRERDIFTTEELKRLFPDKTSEVGPWRNLRDKVAFLLAANGGLRRSELRAVTWGAIDFNLNLLTIRQAFKGGGDRLGKPKSGKVRYVRLTEKTARHLQAWRLQTPFKNAEDYCFTNAQGKPLGGQWWEMAFKAAMVSLGIDYRARNLVPHSTRHTLNSHLRAMKVPDFLIRESLGWNSEGVQESYSHLIAEHLEPIAAAAAELF